MRATRITVVMLALLSLGGSVVSGQPADLDADGSPDSIDNCTNHPNPTQMDVDGDGYGNACDPDFDNSGIVDGKDVSALTTHYRSGEFLYDLDADGRVDSRDLKILQQFLHGPPGPGRPDGDSDGFDDARDGCPDTLPGASLISGGCSAFDLVRKPGRLLDPLLGKGTNLLGRFEGTPELALVSRSIGGAMESMEAAGASLTRAQFDRALTELLSAKRQLEAGRDDLARVIAVVEREMIAMGRVPPDEGDHREIDLHMLGLQMGAADIASLLEGTITVETIFTSIRDRSRPMHTRARIDGIDDLRRVIRLDDGTVLSVSDDVHSADLAEAIAVDLEWTALDRGGDSGIATTAVVVASDTDPGVIKLKDCLELRIAPLQRFAPISGGPYLLHHPDGYRYGDQLLLEKGMGLAVEKVCGGEGGRWQSTFVRRSLRVEIDYEDENGGPAQKVLATDLTPGEHPVMFPADAEHGAPAELTVKHHAQNCSIVAAQMTCTSKVLTSTETYSVSLYEDRSRCVASYAETEFALDEAPAGTFRTTTVNNVFALAANDYPAPPTFSAEGYKVWSSVSSFPSAMSIGLNEPFAIFQHDFYDPDAIYAEESTGIDHPSGLRWPAVSGIRNGKSYRYGCRLPSITRDMINACPTSPNSYYRLPFKGGHPTWIMGQGNNGSFTHNGAQAYAFDFIAPEGTPIRAARGGRVTFVRENQTGNSYSNPSCGCMANAIVITHQDGSQGAYFHMPLNGVFKSVGEEVERGELIAEVGNTGFSTTAHLHFHQQSASWPMTSPSRFEAFFPSTTTLLQCYVPSAGDTLSSNQ